MIKVMVDSASDCRSREGIYDIFVPISVNIDGKEYFDGVDIDNDTLTYQYKVGDGDWQDCGTSFTEHRRTEKKRMG